MIKKVGYYKYNTEDIIAKCSRCGGDMVDDISLANFITLTDSQWQDLELGVYTIAFCPNCSQVYLTTVALEPE